MATKSDTDSAFDDIPLVKIHQWGEEHEKIFVLLGEGLHKIKKKAEQIACENAIRVLRPF